MPYGHIAQRQEAMRLGRIQFEFESQCDYQYGKLSERFKEAVLKTVGGDEPSVGSNPTLPASRHGDGTGANNKFSQGLLVLGYLMAHI